MKLSEGKNKSPSCSLYNNLGKSIYMKAHDFIESYNDKQVVLSRRYRNTMCLYTYV